MNAPASFGGHKPDSYTHRMMALNIGASRFVGLTKNQIASRLNTVKRAKPGSRFKCATVDGGFIVTRVA